MIYLKLGLDLLCGMLNSLGGYHWLFCRRYIMPFILGGEAMLLTWEKVKKDWWAGLLILPVIGTLCLAYKNFGSGNFSRAVWLLIQAFIISLGLTLTGHILWYITLPYVVGAGILGGFYRTWQQLIGDFVAGCYLGSIMFFVH